jgi:hypothetical protein
LPGQYGQAIGASDSYSASDWLAEDIAEPEGPRELNGRTAEILKRNGLSSYFLVSLF